MKSRLLVALGLILLWAVALEARLVFLQVIVARRVRRRAPASSSRTSSNPSRRAATSSIATAKCWPTRWRATASLLTRRGSKEPVKDAAEICAALGDCTAKEQTRLAANLKGDWQVSRREESALRFARRVDPPAGADRGTQEGRTACPPSSSLNAESRRYYPKLDLASHILGFVGRRRPRRGGHRGASTTR